MNLVPIFTFLVIALASDIIRTGSLFITEIDKTPTRQRLVIRDGNLALTAGRSLFDFKPEGFLKLNGHEEYLSVDNSGNLVLESQPHTGFNLTTEKFRRRLKRRLSYNGDEAFELCANNSIAYKSGCPGARTVLLNYVDLVTPVFN